MSHRAFVSRAKDQRAFQKTKNAMLLERGHETNDPLLLEKRGTPLDRFFHIRTTGVDGFAQMFQNRPSKRRGAFNISVNASILISPSISSRFRAAFATSWL